MPPIQYNFFKSDTAKIMAELGAERLRKILREMLLIRNFEVRAESAYQQGKIGGFFHSYIGQEAIQVGAVEALGPNNWFATTYRVHALPLLLGEPPPELMAELYGKATGNAKGRGGSMHLYSKRVLGGFGIVGGQIPVATGAAFSIKYQGKKEEVSICFLGDGAVPQGSFHESLNLASLWSLPCIYVIENNQWGMGTHFLKANCVPKLAEDRGASYNMKAYSFYGMDFFNCYAGFAHIKKEMLENSRPVLVEVVTERFKGHSVSDPGLYRTKDALKESMQKDPLILLQHELIKAGIVTEEEVKQIDKECREIVVQAMKFAEESPWPDVATLEEDVYAPEQVTP